MIDSLSRFSSRFLVGALVLMLVLGVSAIAQETTGAIGGQVSDPSGAAVPNAKVTLSGGALPRALEATSDSTGSYTFGQVPIGSYTLSANAAGFQTTVKSGTPVVIGKHTRLDFKLEVGRVTESVVIAADALLVDTASSTSAINVDKSFFDLLPKGRSFYDLVAIAPGARNESKTGGIQVDGASGSENVFYLDGMEVTNVQTGVLSDQNKIPVEMVQQVQVKNGVMEAQYGGAMGGVVNAVVRSGSNDWHGQGGFYFDNDSMSARLRPTLEMDPTDASRTRGRYFQNTMDDYSKWNPVFSIGGPILKNKLFMFAGYMPTLTSTNRTVTFLSNNKTGTYNRKSTQHYLSGKLDYAPADKLRMSGSWLWNPTHNSGVLPARQGTDSYDRNWAGLGDYTAGNMIIGQVDYLASSKLIISFRGGYNYTNNTNRYAGSTNTFIYSTANTMYPEIPADMRFTSTGWVQQGTALQDYNIYKRVNLNADASYLANWQGQHSLKFGWQTNRLSNEVQNLSYPTGYYRFYWGPNQVYRCVTTQCTGQQTGKYGYYRWYTYGENGDASSDNQGLFFQDNWRVNKHLSLNLGLRTEREFLPSFAKTGVAAAPPIEFGWAKKMSPRIGGAWDPKGDGKMRIYASWGYFYDVMKYEMPRGSFGGALYVTNYYAIDDLSIFNTLKNYGYPSDPSKLPGRFFESVDWRIPSNDPKSCEKQGLSCTGMTIDPDLKPMKQKMLDLGYDYSINSTLVASVRYTNRRLIRTIEDVGTLGSGGEVYYIANPGEGITIDRKTWEPGFPVTPKAIRNYDAVEFRLDKRFSKNYQFASSYTWSRQYGNYSGLASSDEPDANGVGRTAPNVNRYFDLPWLGYTEKGVMSEGPLATDRPHTLKFFGSYSKKSFLGSTSIAPQIQVYSGSPLTTQIDAISTVPVYPYNRGDMGRTPIFHNFDVNLAHDFVPVPSKENVKIRFEFSVFNLFNSGIVTNNEQVLQHVDDGHLQFDHDADIFKGFNTTALMKAQDIDRSPLFGQASGWQRQRTLRLQLSFSF